MFVRRYGDGPALVALHGFTLTGAQFEPVAKPLRHRILAPDLPGHGATRLRPVSLDGTISLLANWLERQGAPLPVLGYSQGARVGLLLALDHPELVSELVLVSGSPGIRGRAVRARRREADDTTATRIEAGGLDEFLDGWLTQPLTSNAAVSPEAAAKDRAVRSENTPSGLAAALRNLGQGALPFVGDRLRDLPMRLLTIAGARDLKYRALAMEMAAAAPHGSCVIFDSAGHNVVLEQPQALASAVAEFLAEAPGD